MKRYIKYLLSFVIVTGAVSCNEFLEENPNTLTTQANVTSIEAARAFLASIYGNVNLVAVGSGGWGGNTLSLLEFMSGKADGVAQTEAFRFNQLTHDSQAFYIDTYWQSAYQGILRCNVALKQIPGFSVLNETQKAEFLAEVRALRAFYYFYLVRMFGDVPMVTEPITSLNDVNTPRTPVKQIYDQVIIPDLLEAEKAPLPWRRPNGEVSRGFVKALLADVYLTYAGFPVNAGQSAYVESAKRSKELVDLRTSTFPLFKEYREMILPSNKNTGEFIFQVQFDKVNRNNPLTPVVLPTFAGISRYANEFGGLVPRVEFIRSFDPNDKRVAEKQYFFTEYNGKQLGGHYIYKWFDKVAVDSDTRSELNFSIYRMPDVMLMYAEASNRAEGSPNQLAKDVVNEIRARATLAPIGNLNSEAFEREVWNQRYFELSFEGKIWFDMVRTRKVRNDVTKQYDDFIGHRNVFGATFQERNLLFPIPLREIQTNPILTQNTGF
ncbi:RagB/SusD family nutrient uptake outer membrane protein [Algoriphagus sp. AK58]|uniref:RagB/SusD family nutrient uptake outer membrane protein n=1 Tax=Algoriphagus sp. AK58 TaxID=1406877 RepID=UPI00165019A0|nr:RagB/SusD family nutrient uptake outer membrane protein [Algoriphagus sp. AK58]MBC6365963.1 RagB/SusD family nutrient uptake outer membrane protein [Algoriphagus sp. AK58]